MKRLRLQPITLRLFYMFIGLLLTGCISISNNGRGKAVKNGKVNESEMSFERVRKLIVIEAKINGVKGRFLFDNGFTLSAVNKDFAEKANISFSNAVHVNDANQKSKAVPETTIDSVEIGHVCFLNTGFYQIETSNFFPCNDIDGVIGASIINKANWHIKSQQNVMILSTEAFEKPEQSSSLKVSFIQNNSAITLLEIEGKKFKTKVDLGSTNEISVRSSDIEDALNGQRAEKKFGIMSLSANGLGNTETSYQMHDRISVTHKKYSLSVPAEIEIVEKQKHPGYIGLGYMDHYDFILNSTQKEYVLIPIEQAEEEPERSYGLSFYMVNGECRIIQKNDFDPLVSDVELMTVVEEIDGTKANSFASICELRDFLRPKFTAGLPFTIKLEGSNELLVLPYREIVMGEIHNAN